MAAPPDRRGAPGHQDLEPAYFDSYASTYTEAVNASIAITGDSVDHFARVKAELVAAELAGAHGLRILDFGCGTGVSTTALAAALPVRQRLSGVDPSAESISIARSRGHDGLDYEMLSGDTLPFADASFDVVFTACVFHHIERADHAKWLAEIRRVLAPGGRFFLFEHNPNNPLTRRAVRACPFDEGVTLLTPRYAAGQLRRAGFAVGPPHYYYFFPRALAALRPLEPALAWCGLGAQYYVRADKPGDGQR